MSKVLLTPDPDNLVRAQHDLRMFELVNSSTAGNLPDAGFSLAYLMLQPDESTGFHYHDSAFVLVFLLTAGAEGAATDVVFLDDTSTAPEELSHATAVPIRYVQHPGQALVIPPRQPHRATNLSSTTTLTGFEVRVRSESVFADNNLLPFLNGLGFQLVGSSATP